MKIYSRLRAGLSVLEPGTLALRRGRCPFCGPSLFLRLNHGEAGVRCLRCAASTVHLSIGQAVADEIPSLAGLDVYELSAAGPYVEHLRRQARRAVFSEYHPDVAPGQDWNGVRCEDVQALTWPDAHFDLVTHTEVFEHVPDDARGFAELRRVLRRGGRMLFSVPLFDAAHTVERARLGADGIEYLLPAEYHVDPFKGNAQVLVFRDYGHDIVQRLEHAGFGDIRIQAPSLSIPWAPLRPVIRATAI